MKTNLKYQNGKLPTKKKSKRLSLGRCALIVIGAYLLCSVALSPISAALGQEYEFGKTDVAVDGTFYHTMLSVGAQVFFYLSSLLSTAAFFVGASYIVNFAIASRRDSALGAAAITFLGLNVGSLLTLGAYVILRIGNPRISLTDSTASAILYEGLFALVCVGAVTAGSFLLVSKRVSLIVYPLTCATIMFVGAVGFELAENIPFFLNGTVLSEDVIRMILSMLIYVVHAFVGFVIMLRMIRKAPKP